MNKYIFSMAVASIALVSCQNTPQSGTEVTETEFADTLRYEQEEHIKNLRQLTFGGDNAEAYWSFGNKKVVFQRMNPNEGVNCDQIYVGDIPAWGEQFSYTLASTGKGRTTCSYFLQGDSLILGIAKSR